MPDNGKQESDDSKTRSLGGGDQGAGHLPHEKLGPFRIESTIGTGGMGTVYRAFDESMKRTVALKVLHPALEVSASTQQRFVREAWIAGQLDHPNIIQVYSRGEDQGAHYIAMELAEAGSLADCIRARKESRPPRGETTPDVGPDYIRRILTQFVKLAEALELIHRKGFIHRDIKPHNILLAGENKPFKLTDFGIAHAENMTQVTRAGDFIGTIRYMSPELLTSQAATVDKRTDIYSLGVSLYESLTLSLPFEGRTEQEYISEVMAGHRVPARRRNKWISKDLEIILTVATDPDPAVRYDSAALFADDLLRVLDGRPTMARKEKVSSRALKFIKRNRRRAAALTIVLCAFISMGVWYWIERSSFARLEELVRTFESGVPFLKSRGARQLGGDELKLCQAFLTRQLNVAQASRVARLLLEPRIRVSEYVGRAVPNPIACDVEWSNADWQVSSVIQLKIITPDSIIESQPMPPPGIYGFGLTSEMLSRLPLGRNRITLEVHAWIFSDPEIRKRFGRELWNSALTGMWSLDTSSAVATRWHNFWTDLQDSKLSVWSGVLQVVKEFQVVEELPRDFPAGVSSPDIDSVLHASVHFGDFTFNTMDTVCFEEEIKQPLPAPLAGWIAVVSESGDTLCMFSITREQGTQLWTTWCVYGLASRASLAEWWPTQEPDDSVPVTVHFVGAREVAAFSPGFNSYWDGTLEFASVVHIHKGTENR